MIVAVIIAIIAIIAIIGYCVYKKKKKRRHSSERLLLLPHGTNHTDMSLPPVVSEPERLREKERLQQEKEERGKCPAISHAQEVLFACLQGKLNSL